MSRNQLENTLLRLAQPAVKAQGLDIWGLEILDGQHMTVRLFVEIPQSQHALHEEVQDDAAENDAAQKADVQGSLSAQGAQDAQCAQDAQGAEGDAAQPLEDDIAVLSASVDQCEAISRQFSLALDAEDVIDRAYTLEVSTPGFNRIFFKPEQMKPYTGELIEARMGELFAPGPDMPKRRTWKGILEDVREDSFVLAPASADNEGEIRMESMAPVTIPFAKARRVSRIHVFRKPAKPGKGPGKAQKKGKKA